MRKKYKRERYDLVRDICRIGVESVGEIIIVIQVIRAGVNPVRKEHLWSKGCISEVAQFW